MTCLSRLQFLIGARSYNFAAIFEGLYFSVRKSASLLGLLVFLAPGSHADDPAVQAWAQDWLDALAATGTGSSNRVLCALLMTEPASAARGELTDKGSLNQAAVQQHRAATIDALYDPARHDPDVIYA